MSEQNKVRLETSAGNITIELDFEKAPITCANFKKYVEEGFYKDTIFHRIIPGFMAQCGGMTADMKEKSNHAPIENEATNGLKNLRGTLAMARTQVVNSATSQFFINLVDNGFLDHKSPNPAEFGYAVFGKVIDGMEAVDTIASVPTGTKGFHQDVPLEPVLIRNTEFVD